VIAHLFLPKNSPPPYPVVAVMGGATITDVLKRVEDLDYPYEFIVRGGRAVLIPAYSGTLERGPTPFGLLGNQWRDRAINWSKDLGRSIDYLQTRADVDKGKLAFYGVFYGRGRKARGLSLWIRGSRPQFLYLEAHFLDSQFRRSARGTSLRASTSLC
jgi:hypothetical protein